MLIGDIGGQVASKIGRNEKCPCGSGKKYKNCHLRIEESQKYSNPKPIDNGSSVATQNFEDLASRYEKANLLKNIAALHIDPNNSGATIRLEVAGQSVAKLRENNARQEISKEELEKLLNSTVLMQETERMEDPLENPYLENFCFEGQNYAVYTGSYSGGIAFEVEKLCDTLHGIAEAHHDDIRVLSLLDSIRALLLVSKNIAIRAGHEWPLEVEDKQGEPIQIGNLEAQAKLARALTFPTEALSRYFTNINMSIDSLDRFVTELDDKKIGEGDIHKHPFGVRPLVRIGNEYIVVQPASIMAAIRQAIILYAIECEILRELISKYLLINEISVHKNMQILGYSEISFVFPLNESGLLISESLWRFDLDKVCYVQIITDDGNEFDEHAPLDREDNSELERFLETRSNAVLKEVWAHQEYKGNKILILNLSCGLGRFNIMRIQNYPKNTKSIFMRTEELKVVAELRETDELTLWKYSIAVDLLQETTSYFPTSFLDLFYIYWKKNRTFYITDSEQPNMLVLGFENQRLLRLKTQNSMLLQFVRHFDQRSSVSVAKMSPESYSHIFVRWAAVSSRFEQLVFYKQLGIWVVPMNYKDLSKDLLGIYGKFQDTILFWLSAIVSLDNLVINSLRGKTICILFELENPKLWTETLNNRSASKPEGSIARQIEAKVKSNGCEILLTLKSGLIWSLQQNDNKGELAIISEILRCIFSIVDDPKRDEGNCENFVNEIIGVVGRDSLTKHLSFHDAFEEVDLYPIFGPSPRLVQKHDLEMELNELGRIVSTKLGLKSYVPGEISTHYRDVFSAIFDSYLERIKASISGLDNLKLLSYLLALNESLLHEKAVWMLTSPHNVLSKFGQGDPVGEIADKFRDLDGALVAVRFLVEFVYAEKPTGIGPLTREKLDGLIALGYGYVNWGMMWEHIRCELTEPKLAFLGSGRIGVSDRREDDMSKFLYVKTLEGVENKDRAYRGSESGGDEAGTSDSEAYDSEFEAEFGIRSHEIFMFGMAMAFVGFEGGMPSALMDFDEVVSKLKERNLSDHVIAKGFDCFAFTRRNGWSDFDSGFSEADILPWRFGRKLSGPCLAG